MRLSYDVLAKRFNRLQRRDPLYRAWEGDFSEPDALPISSLKEIHAVIAEAHALARLIEKECAPGTRLYQEMTLDQKIDMRRAVEILDAERLGATAKIDGTMRFQIQPFSLQILLASTENYLERDPRPPKERVRGFIRRFHQFPQFLDSDIKTLDRPHWLWTKQELEVGKGFDLCAETVTRYAKAVKYRQMGRLERSIEIARQASAKYMCELRELPIRRKMTVGHEVTQKQFALAGIPYTLDQLHAMAIEFYNTQMDRIDQAATKLGPKYGHKRPWQLLQQLKKENAVPKGSVVQRLTMALDQATEFAYNNMVNPLKRAQAVVRPTPAYLIPDVPIAAVSVPGAFSKGIKKSICYVTEFPGVEKELGELLLPSMTAHELIPGHHYQFSRAGEHPSLVRKWDDPMELAEGWTTYVAEELMTAMGYVGDESRAEEEYLIRLFDLIRIAPRVGFNLACLTGDRDYLKGFGVPINGKSIFTESTNLYQRITRFPKYRAKGDVELFSGFGTYASEYLIGYMMMKELHEMSERKGTPTRDFLEAILVEGKLPLFYIAKKLHTKEMI